MTDWDVNTTFIERMKDASPLTFGDFREMLDWLKKTYEIRAIDMLQLRVAIQLDQTLGETRRAIERFDDSSRKLTCWLGTDCNPCNFDACNCRIHDFALETRLRSICQGMALAMPKSARGERL